jgi:hypothetical protein
VPHSSEKYAGDSSVTIHTRITRCHRHGQVHSPSFLVDSPSKLSTHRSITLLTPFLFRNFVMRIAVTLLLLFVVTLAASADEWRRARWRAKPRIRHSFNAYNVWNPGYDSSYYSPYGESNTSKFGTTTPDPIPVTGTWQPVDPQPAQETWNDRPSTTSPSTNSTTVDENTTRWNHPSPQLRQPNVQTPSPVITTPASSPRQTPSTNYQRRTPQSSYWNGLGGSTD